MREGGKQTASVACPLLSPATFQFPPFRLRASLLSALIAFLRSCLLLFSTCSLGSCCTIAMTDFPSYFPPALRVYGASFHLLSGLPVVVAIVYESILAVPDSARRFDYVSKTALRCRGTTRRPARRTGSGFEGRLLPGRCQSRWCQRESDEGGCPAL